MAAIAERADATCQASSEIALTAAPPVENRTAVPIIHQIAWRREGWEVTLKGQPLGRVR